MKLSGEITISRPSYGNGDEFIEIEFTDCNSRTKFVRAYIRYDDFTKALTGQAAIPAKLSVHGLAQVGLERETKPLVFLLPDGHIGARDYAEKVCQTWADKGWTANTYFGSQTSFKKHDDGFYYAHGTQSRFVKLEEIKNE